jgi:hypothetical protein
MDNDFRLSAKAWVAIALVVGLYLGVAVSSESPVGTLFYGVVAISTAGVAAFDSMHIHLRHYRTWISYGPIGVFIVCALFLPVAIVCYFIVRLRIARGTMLLRDEFKPGQSRTS